MEKVQRLTTRSGFADRLGLHEKDLARRPASKVADAITCFYDLDGNCIGEHHRKVHPFLPSDEETFILYVEQEQEDRCHALMSA